MHRLKTEWHSPGVAAGLLLTLLAMSSCSGPAPEQAAEESETVTVYEGARLIVGGRAGHRERHVRRRQRPVPGGRRGRRDGRARGRDTGGSDRHDRDPCHRRCAHAPWRHA